jgi:hypothetical protein
MIPDGLVIYSSPHEPAETMHQLAGAVTLSSMTALAHIDQRRASSEGRHEAAAYRGHYLRESASGHAADLGATDHWDRFTAESSGVAGR